MPATYEPIATTTLGSASATITFSSIPATYTDLRLIFTFTQSIAQFGPFLTFNNDSATNYSQTKLAGNGTSALSARVANNNWISPYQVTNSTTIPSFLTFDIFSYAGSTFKTVLINNNQDQNGSGAVSNFVGLWRSTAAINRLDLQVTSGTFNTGTTATLYGIKAA